MRLGNEKKIIMCISIAVLVFWMAGCSEVLTKGSTSTEEMDTGAWNSGIVYYNGYKISIECSEVGHPSGESLWSVYYTDVNSDKDINVDIYGKEGSCEDRIEELIDGGYEMSEGKLWGNSCHYYIEDVTIALIPLGDDGYLQIEIDSGFESARVPNTFTLTIEKER